ncbi:hypothetical protein J0H33_14685 [bacterium]|jgi:hypothetical protein|nr:hypothetical protein [bacterium]
MKTLWGSVAAMFLFAGIAFGLPAFLPEAHPQGVPTALLDRLKSTALAGSSKPALWVDVKSAHVAPQTPAGVAGTVELRTLFGFNWASITLFDDGTTASHYHEGRQWAAIIVFVLVELALGGVVIWNVFH